MRRDLSAVLFLRDAEREPRAPWERRGTPRRIIRLGPTFNSGWDISGILFSFNVPYEETRNSINGTRPSVRPFVRPSINPPFGGSLARPFVLLISGSPRKFSPTERNCDLDIPSSECDRETYKISGDPRLGVGDFPVIVFPEQKRAAP